MDMTDPLRLNAMAPELSPELINCRPSLPSPPRKPLWHNDPTIPYTLSTHIIDAAPFRTCPEFEPVNEVSMTAYAKMHASEMDPKIRQKLAKENVALMWKWRKELEDSRRNQGKLGIYERPLWICLNRYVKKNLDGAPRKIRGLTLFFAHGIGFNKETVEPLISSLLKSRAGRDVEEIWVWESVDNGDSALLNAGKLNQLSDWYDGARDVLHFLLHYIPSKVVSDELPVYLPRISPTEFEDRVHHGFSERHIIASGHSFGGNICARACFTYPQLFTALVLMDPGIIERNCPTLKPTLTFMAQSGFTRRNTWKSREEALSFFLKSPFFRAFSPDILKLYVEYGLYSSESGDVCLKMHPVHEALSCTNGLETSEDMYDKVPALNTKVYIRWVMPDQKKGGGLAGVKASEILVKRRLGHSSSVNIPDASHMIPLEKPAKVAQVIADTIEIVFALSPKL